LFAAVGGVTVELPAGAFLNVNTPADRDRAERRLARAAALGATLPASRVRP
jgi:hypothetical protein